MKKIILTLTAALSFGSAHAGFGSLSSIASKVAEDTTGVSSSDVDVNGFLTKANITSKLFLESRAQLAYALASKANADELKTRLTSLQGTSNLKEKEAIQKEIKTLSDQVLEASKKDEVQTIQMLQAMDVKKRQFVVDSISNFIIAAINAAELVKNSKQVSLSIAANPLTLKESGLSLSDSKSLISNLSDIAKNSSGALIEYPKLLKKAGIKYIAPTSAATKPKEVAL